MFLREGRPRLAVERAAAALRAGDRVEAELQLRGCLLQAPRDVQTLTMLAQIAAEDCRLEEAAMLLRRAAAAEPAPELHLALARQVLALAGPAAALAELETFPAATRRARNARLLQAQLLGMSGRPEEQLEIYADMIGAGEESVGVRITQAFPLNAVGRLDDAVASLRKAIALDPLGGEAWWALANLKGFRFSGDDVAAMLETAGRTTRPSDRVALEFALGCAFEQRKDYERSFHHYAEGNRLGRAGLLPEQMRVTEFVDSAIENFTPELFERHADSGCPEQGPVFVLGLHRSGSTLIEQILSSHPQIEGAGELPVMQHIRDRLIRSAGRANRDTFEDLKHWEPERFAAIGAEYLERTRPFRSTDKSFFVDKLPPNWLSVGLIRLALPNAKIIDARRAPMACGFSNFKQHYAMGVTFAYSLQTIGQFYRDYLRMMDHLDRVQPGAILHVANERLIEDPERELRRMLDFIGVPFEPACLDFHRNKRAVQTPSADQVRRPINRAGVEAWKPFEPWLGELKDALGPALENWLPVDD